MGEHEHESTVRMLPAAILAAIALGVTPVAGIADNLAIRSTPTDLTYLDASSVWRNGSVDTNPETNMGHSALQAALYATTGQPAYHDRAVRSVDAYVASGPLSTVDVNDGFAAVSVGLARYALAGEQHPAWDAYLRSIVDKWLAHGDLPDRRNAEPRGWVANGNISLNEALVAEYAARFNPSLAYLRAAADDAIAFALDPGPSPRWDDRGLRITKQPTKADGSDGMAYLCEYGGVGEPGYDGNYTALQADFASELALVTGAPADVRLANMLWNTVRAHSTPDPVARTWTLDARGGTRKSFLTPMITSAPFTLGLLYGRTDLWPELQGMFDSMVLQLRLENPYAGWSRSMGTTLGVTVLAAARARG